MTVEGDAAEEGDAGRAERPKRRISTRMKALNTLLVLGLLAGGVYVTKPQWQHWWYGATACDGVFSAGDLDAVFPSESVEPMDEVIDREQGLLSCGFREDSRNLVLRAEAHTRPDAVDGELAQQFTIASPPDFAFPWEVPGYYTSNGGPLTILQTCPDLGRDARGNQRRMVTTVQGHWDDEERPAAMLRVAVATANAATQRLGCGAERLDAPERAQPAEPKPVRLKQAADTPCGGLAEARLPGGGDGGAWRAAARTRDDAPITDCTLVRGDSRVTLTGWYGEWSEQPFYRLAAGNLADLTSRELHGPVQGESFGRATARCAGEPANFLADTGPDEEVSAEQLRELLGAFARSQAVERDCTGLKLPEGPVRKGFEG